MAKHQERIGNTLIFDGGGLSKLAAGDLHVRGHFEAARRQDAYVVTSAINLVEVLRGGPRDARIHHVLSKVIPLAVTPELGRRAGELLGATGLSGHRCAIDAVVAATALGLPRPVVLLTTDPDDLSKLTEEPGCPKDQRVVVVKV